MLRTGTLEMTEGSPLRLLAIFALPLLVGNLFQQAYGLADSIIVGRLLGADSLAAVGATGSISFLFTSFFGGICGGCGVVTAQYFGAKNRELVQRCIVNSLYITLAFSMITGLLAFSMTPVVLGFMGTPQRILPQAIVYMRMVSAGVPFVAVFNYASSMERALGDSKTPLYFLVVACLMNIPLDFLFVGPLGLGVFGAALATVLSQFLAGIGSLLFARKTNPLFQVERTLLDVSFPIIKAALRMGLPLALQWSMIAVSVTALQSTVNSFGPTAVAAFTVTNRMEELVMQPYNSVSAAMTTYCGQNMGAGRFDRIQLGLRHGLLAMAILAGALSVFMFTMSRNLVSLFVREEEVIAMGGAALRITSVFFLSLGVIYVIRGVLNGVGDAFFALINGIVELFGRIGLPLIFIRVLGGGVFSCWYTVGLTWFISAVGCVFRYFFWKKKWKGKLA